MVCPMFARATRWHASAWCLAWRSHSSFASHARNMKGNPRAQSQMFYRKHERTFVMKQLIQTIWCGPWIWLHCLDWAKCLIEAGWFGCHGTGCHVWHQQRLGSGWHEAGRVWMGSYWADACAWLFRLWGLTYRSACLMPDRPRARESWTGSL